MPTPASRMAALLGAGVLVGTALTGSPAEAAPRASAQILKVPRTLSVNAAAADVTVSYRCRDDATSIYFLRFHLFGEGGNYDRGDPDAPVPERLRATCTGRKVTETIALYSAGGGPITGGTASLSINLYNLAPPPGMYYGQPGTGPEDFASATVRVKVSR